MLIFGSIAKNLAAVVLFILLINHTNTASVESDLVHALVNGINKNNNVNAIQEHKHSSDVVTEEEANTITVIMSTLLPSMFGLFSNITSDDYKANFKEPCRFDTLMDLFKQLPPYFDVIAKKYPGQPDLIAYYSMQLASTFLVNNGSLTMECMYNMLSLQTRLNNFSLDIMDNPEKNPKLVGLFGIFMKPIMKMLKKNAMMKIIEHVDRYEKNDDRENIVIFHILNFFYVVVGTVGILSNILLIVLLRRSSIATKDEYRLYTEKRRTRRGHHKNEHEKLPLNHTHSLKMNRNLKAPVEHTISIGSMDRKIVKPMHLEHRAIELHSGHIMRKQQRLPDGSKPKQATLSRRPTAHKKHTSKKFISEYSTMKSSNAQMYYYMRKKYKTRICFVLIAICHSLYILINFIVMSQASLAAMALKGLSQINIACKMAFFLFPPTTAYNILHQFAIWMLCYAIRQHGLKLRKTRAFNADLDADHDINNLMHSDSESSSYNNDYPKQQPTYETSANEDNDEDTVSVSLTNNSNNLIITQSGTNWTPPPSKSSPAAAKSINTVANYHQILTHPRHLVQHQFTSNKTTAVAIRTANPYKTKAPQTESCLCYFFSHKRRNAMFCLVLLALLLIYDAQGLFLYSLTELKGKTSTVYFCAFDEGYAQYYSVLSQLALPLTNLCLFSLLPLLLCTMQVLFDACFLVRVQREQMKRYEKLKEVIEWPLYAYFFMTVISQAPFALHQVIDLCIGTTKFPFVFPLFIQLKFSNKVWLSVFEMSSIFIACASDFYLWMVCDKEMRKLAVNWLNKRILCRTYKKTMDTNGRGNALSSHSNSRTSEVDSSSTSSSFSSSNRSESIINQRKHLKNIYSKPSSEKQQEQSQQQGRVSTVVDTDPPFVNSSVTSSTTSEGFSHKKQISPIIAAAADTAAATAKAAAAISASMGPPSIYDNFKKDPTNTPISPTFSSDSVTIPTNQSSSQPPTRIKMIDTDIDDIEDIDIDNMTQNTNTMTKVSEEKEQPPPSFNTATRKTPPTNTAGYRQQYQNIDLQALVERP